jgi:hypothetical protein
MHRNNLNCEILTAAIILSHSTDNCSHEVVNSHVQVFFNCEPPAENSLTTERNLSYKPSIGHAETNSASNIALGSLLRVYSCSLATRGAARHGTEKTLLLLLLRNRWNVFRSYSSCMEYICHNIRIWLKTAELTLLSIKGKERKIRRKVIQN